MAISSKRCSTFITGAQITGLGVLIESRQGCDEIGSFSAYWEGRPQWNMWQKRSQRGHSTTTLFVGCELRMDPHTTLWSCSEEQAQRCGQCNSEWDQHGHQDHREAGDPVHGWKRCCSSLAQDAQQGQACGVGLGWEEGLPSDRGEARSQEMVCGFVERSKGWEASVLCDDRSFIWFGLGGLQLQPQIGCYHWYLEKSVQCGGVQFLRWQVWVRTLYNVPFGISASSESSFLAWGSVRRQEVADVRGANDLGRDVRPEIHVFEDQTKQKRRAQGRDRLHPPIFCVATRSSREAET